MWNLIIVVYYLVTEFSVSLGTVFICGYFYRLCIIAYIQYVFISFYGPRSVNERPKWTILKRLYLLKARLVLLFEFRKTKRVELSACKYVSKISLQWWVGTSSERKKKLNLLFVSTLFFFSVKRVSRTWTFN